jgi:hypothetical protein
MAQGNASSLDHHLFTIFLLLFARLQTFLVLKKHLHSEANPAKQPFSQTQRFWNCRRKKTVDHHRLYSKWRNCDITIFCNVMKCRRESKVAYVRATVGFENAIGYEDVEESWK